MSDWQKRSFGNTELTVSALGLGTGQIGDGKLSEQEVSVLLNEALDAGITLFDTARGYNLSEERIGRHLGQRRSEFVLSTKIGYDIPGHTDWTGPIITAGIEAALQKLQTDYIDIVHLHSCSVEILEQGEVITALQRAVQAGKVRVAAYSGDNEPLEWAVEHAPQFFQSIETSINFCDQRVIEHQLLKAHQKNLGVIAKRPIANAPWRFARQPIGDYSEEYWLRWKAMQPDARGLDWTELALRFTAFLPGVSSCIVGTASLEHLRYNLKLLEAGPLPPDHVTELRQAFLQHDQNWVGQV